MSLRAHHLPIAYIVLLVLITSLYVGCSNQQQTGDIINYRFGSQGLYMQFEPRNQYTFYDGDRVSLLLDLANKGTADIVGGQLFLSGFDPNIVNLRLNPSDIFTINGKDEFDPNGEMSTLYTIESSPIRLPPNRDRVQQPIQVTACYEYRTLATAEVCVDPDPYNRRVGNKVCQLAATGYGAQGHPVVISSVTPHVSENDIRFTIGITNSGGGLIFDRVLSDYDCGMGLLASDVDKIYVNRVTLGGKLLSCEPQNPVRLRSGAGTIVCDCPQCVDSENAYTTVLEMELVYGYRQVLNTQLTLLRD